MKKLTSILVSLLMLFSISIPTFAVGEGTEKIIIRNVPSETGVTLEKDAYSAYKIFDVKIIEGQEGEKNKYEYTVSANFNDFFSEKGNPEEYINSKDINIIAAELRGYINEKNISPEKKNGDVVTTNSVETTEITNLDKGYYIILGQSKDSNGMQVVAAAALKTTDNDFTINIKASAPTIDKEVKEGNEWGDGSGAQIGDIVEYRLTATLPSSVTGYNQYIYRIHDKLSEGLTFNPESLKVYVGDRELTDYYNLNFKIVDGHTFDLTVDVLNGHGKEDGFALGDKLYIYYNATLNENALIAGGANKNDVNLEYSNNPYDDSKTTTPDITVNSYTFKISALKVDENKTPLQGAEFELSKGANKIHFIETQLGDGTNVYKVCNKKPHENECTTTITSGSNGKFDIVGLDDNVQYTLTETKAPDGYNKLKDPITFTINATYKDGILTGVTVTPDGSLTVDGFDLSTTIVNTSNSLLPETGGIGTTLFAVVGGSLMMFAASVLILKKRKKA